MLWTIEQRKEGVVVTFDSNLLFGNGSARLNRYAKERICELASVVADFSNNRIHLVDGANCGRRLSTRRANVVANLVRSSEMRGARSLCVP